MNKLISLLFLVSFNLWADIDRRVFHLNRDSNWITSYEEEEKYSFKIDTSLLVNNNINDIIDSFSMEEDELINFIDNNFSNNYMGAFNFNIDYRKDKWEYSVYTFLSSKIGINNPIFLELDGYLLHEYGFKTSYKCKWKFLNFNNYLILGKRKYIPLELSVSDVVADKIDMDIENYDYRSFLEAGFSVDYKLEDFVFLGDISGIPIAGYFPINYLKMKGGVQNNNFLVYKGFKLGSYIYLNHYFDKEDTLFDLMSWGGFINYKNIKITPYFRNEYSEGQKIDIKLSHLNLSLYRVSQSFDRIWMSVENQWGTRLSLKF